MRVYILVVTIAFLVGEHAPQCIQAYIIVLSTQLMYGSAAMVAYCWLPNNGMIHDTSRRIPAQKKPLTPEK